LKTEKKGDSRVNSTSLGQTPVLGNPIYRRDEAPEKIRDPGTPSIIPSGAVVTAGWRERFTDGAITTVASSASSPRSTESSLERHPRFVDVARETPARSNPTISLAESIPQALGQSFFR
jgi:hypothetical protein